MADLAIDEAAAVLARGRDLYPANTDIYEVMLITMAGGSPIGCTPTLRAASGAKQQGTLLMSVCAGEGCAVACAAEVASSPRYYFELDEWGYPIVRDPAVSATDGTTAIRLCPAGALYRA